MGNMKRFLENVNEEIAFLKRGIALYEDCLREADKSHELRDWEAEAKARERDEDKR